MILLRWILGLPMAAIITVGIFMMMAGLIQKPIGPLPASTEGPVIDILMDPEPPEGPTIPHQPKVPKEQPPVDIIETLPSEKPKPSNTAPAPGETGPGPGPKPMQMSGAIIRVDPPYPEACRSKGIEGVVLIQFDVTAEGNVVNVQIIDAPDRCFNRIVSAVSKWKYPPAYLNGRPVKRYGVVERFNFQLTD